MKFGEIKLIDNYESHTKGKVIDIDKRIARIIGFYESDGIMIAFCQYILRRTMKPNGKSTCIGIPVNEIKN